MFKFLKNIVFAIALLYLGAWLGTDNFNVGRDYGFKKAKQSVTWVKTKWSDTDVSDEDKNSQPSNGN